MFTLYGNHTLGPSSHAFPESHHVLHRCVTTCTSTCPCLLGWTGSDVACVGSRVIIHSKVGVSVTIRMIVRCHNPAPHSVSSTTLHQIVPPQPFRQYYLYHLWYRVSPQQNHLIAQCLHTQTIQTDRSRHAPCLSVTKPRPRSHGTPQLTPAHTLTRISFIHACLGLGADG